MPLRPLLRQDDSMTTENAIAAPGRPPEAAASAATAGEACDGVIHFGNVDWWYHNRGHASTRMATRIARRVPTVWVNSIGMRMPVPGKTEIAYTRYLRKLKSLTKGLRRDPDSGMYVYSPIFIPRYSPRMLEMNGRLLAWQVRWLCGHLGIRHPSALVSMPTMTPAVERLKWVKVVFDRCDDFTTLPEADAPLVGALERRLLALSDAAVYVHQGLMERERGQVSQSVFIGHGVDFERYVAARPIGGARAEAPAAIRNVPRPIVGFFGGMDDYRMDAALMVKIARHIAPATFVLIGPKQMDLSRVEAEPNVRYVGQVAPEQLAVFAAHFDVGVIPFLQNEFNRLCNPTKLKEYLALGFPIVATRLPAFEPYEDLIRTADSHEQFVAALDAAMRDNDAELIQRRRQAVAGSSWDKVAARVAELLEVPALP